MIETLMLFHVAATWYLVGLCWLVQRVQYPLMRAVGESRFVEYERMHVRRITPVVAPPMLIELATAAQEIASHYQRQRMQSVIGMAKGMIAATGGDADKIEAEIRAGSVN